MVASRVRAARFAFVGVRRSADYVSNTAIDGLFRAVVESTEEAILDSMICNETMVGRNGHTSIALPHDQLMHVMKRYGR